MLQYQCKILAIKITPVQERIKISIFGNILHCCQIRLNNPFCIFKSICKKFLTIKNHFICRVNLQMLAVTIQEIFEILRYYILKCVSGTLFLCKQYPEVADKKTFLQIHLNFATLLIIVFQLSFVTLTGACKYLG